MSTSFKRVTGTGVTPDLPLYDQAALRGIEQTAKASLGSHVLMQRAGLAIAQCALAMAPHARKIWIPCGPGNNGGDGLEAAMHLRQWGKEPVASLLRPGSALPIDAAQSLQRAQQAGVAFVEGIPENWDFCIDALLGIGTNRPMDADCMDWVSRINASSARGLAVDVPTGLDAFTGNSDGIFVCATATLTLLGAKPGLFTAHGRDACGDIWLHSLGIEPTQKSCALLNSKTDMGPRLHNSHKGSYGDVAVVGGCQGMTGAAILAALGALHGGAGRVYLAPLDELAPTALPSYPELMLRNVDVLDYSALCVVAGCGGGCSNPAAHRAIDPYRKTPGAGCRCAQRAGKFARYPRIATTARSPNHRRHATSSGSSAPVEYFDGDCAGQSPASCANVIGSAGLYCRSKRFGHHHCKSGRVAPHQHHRQRPAVHWRDRGRAGWAGRRAAGSRCHSA